MSDSGTINHPQPGESAAGLTSIERTQIVDGFPVPAFIYNYEHHLTDLQVYSDGLIYCWEMVDLDIFKQKLANGWVATSIPDGGRLSIFGLGYWTVARGQWRHDRESFYEYVFSIVKKLNPRLENLYDCHGRTTVRAGRVEYSIFSSPNPRAYYTEFVNEYVRHKRMGESLFFFYRDDDRRLYIVKLSIFEDGRIEITNLPEKKILDLSRLKALIDDKKLLSEVPFNETIHFLGFGSFEATAGRAVDIEHKYLEILDVYNQLQGQEGAVAACRRIFEEYREKPSPPLKEKLKNAYENVPPHQRIFVGDMDNKDSEVREIIYGE